MGLDGQSQARNFIPSTLCGICFQLADHLSPKLHPNVKSCSVAICHILSSHFLENELQQVTSCQQCWAPQKPVGSAGDPTAAAECQQTWQISWLSESEGN